MLNNKIIVCLQALLFTINALGMDKPLNTESASSFNTSHFESLPLNSPTSSPWGPEYRASFNSPVFAPINPSIVSHRKMLELQAAYALLEAKVSNLTTEVSTLKSAIDLLTRSQAQKNDTTDEHKGTISLANMSQPTQEAQEVTQETNGQENSWRSVQNRKPRRSHYTSHNHQLVEKQKNKFTK